MARTDGSIRIERERRSAGLSRRALLRAGAATGTAFFVAHATGNYGIVQAAAREGRLPPSPNRGVVAMQDADFNDEPFDPAAVVDGSAGWFPSVYGPGDELGALNEVTPQKTLAALQILKNNKNKPPKTYNLGEILEEGMPAFGTRFYTQTRQGPTLAPPYAGDNHINGMEEIFETTYQIATQLDGLPHIGVEDVFYNGFRVPELIEGNTSGVNHLGQELVGPFVTRGVLLDVLSLKVSQGEFAALGEPVDGHPILANSYRITLEDLMAAMSMARIRRIEPGDAVLIRTGWSRLWSLDPVKRARYLATEPGIYLREARWLSQFRPCLVASDTWALEVLPAPDPWTGLQLFPVHQELITRHGIRIGEAFNSEELAGDRVYEFVLFYTGQRARGATAANVAPGALGQPA